jgi:hypothetical protein
MDNVQNAPMNNDDPAPLEQPRETDYSESIKSQVLAKIGKPLRLDRVEVSRHHGGNYRVNIWEHPEPNRHMLVTIAPRIGLSYYLTVSNTGEITHSNPPLIRRCAPA